MTTRYRWLLFDADDTLFDFGAAEAKALAEAFDEADVPFQPAWAPVYQRVNSAAWRAFEEGRITASSLRVQRFEDLFAEIGLGLDPSAFSAVYLRHLGGQSQLVDGAAELVDAVRATHRIAIITNGLADVQRPRVARSAIAPWIEHLVISEEVGAAKPDAAIFDVAMRRMGDPKPAEVLLIGDSLASDIAGGVAYGIDTCWFNPRGKPAGDGAAATYQIGRLGDLLALLGPA